MHLLLRSSLLAQVCLFIGSTPLAAQDRVLESFSVSPDSDMRYQLAVREPCDQPARYEYTTCQAHVVLIDADGRDISSAELAYGFIDAIEPVEDDRGCWSTSGEGLYLETCARRFRLTSDFNGLLVSQAAGGDHIHRNHRLYIARDDSLAEVWSQTSGELGAPTWISVWVNDLDGDGIDELVFLYRAHSWQPEGSEDYWQLFTLGWDVSAGALKKVSEPGRTRAAYAAIVGSYETLLEARQKHEALDRTENPKQGADTSCLSGFRVYRSDYYPRLSPGWFIVAYLSMEREKVEERLAEAETCNPVIDGYVKRAY